MLKGDTRLPLYQRIVDVIYGEITENRWKPGDRIPPENELAELYEVAPGTVRNALSKLTDQGLLEKFHGKGTFVRKPSFDKSLFRFFHFCRPSDKSVIPDSKIIKIKIDTAPAYVSSKLKIAENAEVIFIKRLRLIEDMPVIYEEIYLPRSPFEALLDISPKDFEPLLYPMYHKLCGKLIARAEEELTVESAGVSLAKRLSIKNHSPLIVIDRLARGYSDKPLEWRRSRGRADHFNYHIKVY